MNNLIVSNVSDNIVEVFNQLLDQCKLNNESTGPTDTQNGFQTNNIVGKVPKSTLQELSFSFNNFMEQRSKVFKYDDIYIDHIHLIEYEEGGYQRAHDHYRSEDFSFIVYLNDSDGNTKFHIQDSIIQIKPKKGKLAIFDSFIWHSGDLTNLKKRVAVGAIRMYNKRWVNR